MSVTVSFVDPVTPSRLSEIKAIIESLRAKGTDTWDVRIKKEDEGFTLTISGPQHHRRTYHIYGEQSCDPVYLAALVRTEINSFPASPPQDCALALAALARLGVPYDDTGIFSGRVLVDGEPFTIGTLANLYRSERLESRFSGSR